jgi:hypothetical protein
MKGKQNSGGRLVLVKNRLAVTRKAQKRNMVAHYVERMCENVVRIEQ